MKTNFFNKEYILATDKDFEYVWEPNECGTRGYFHYIGTAEYVIVPDKINGHTLRDCHLMFTETPVKGIACSNPNIRDMSYMFYKSQATSLDVSNLNTSGVTDMVAMFAYSKSICLDLSSFNTSNVLSMSRMFEGSQATYIDLSSFDTSRVSNMELMFYKSKTKELDLASFDTSSLYYFGWREDDTKPVVLEMPKLGTDKITDFEGMFADSKALKIEDYKPISGPIYPNLFEGCKAQVGYARSKRDAERLNASSRKPAELIFTVK